MVAVTTVAERDQLIDEALALVNGIVAFGEALPPEARALPRTPEGWSVTDHVTHLAAWTRWVLEQIQGRSGATQLGLTDAEFTRLFPQFDAINERIHAMQRGTDWDDAVAALRSALEQVTAHMRSATPEQLGAPVMWFDTLVHAFRNTVVVHLTQHLGWMREQVAMTGDA